jgi:hypothetical protein
MGIGQSHRVNVAAFSNSFRASSTMGTTVPLMVGNSPPKGALILVAASRTSMFVSSVGLGSAPGSSGVSQRRVGTAVNVNSGAVDVIGGR